VDPNLSPSCSFASCHHQRAKSCVALFTTGADRTASRSLAITYQDAAAPSLQLFLHQQNAARTQQQ